ncbi:SurA N-terminal domain-containing protein [Bisbaumannia pacifica]|uniref:Periplasmic chaperone PpiD n=1 Tax=Bisbaumannia pacifica TaxID=77098 RepID=A0A510X3T3_9GAMM|nr:SurA N-terminal domain-containing protein [Halomonas pacifica]MBH8578680.1 SurA N-terminal domain-containing protein [Halomonas pacifica]GEK46082.1 peptidylprolyl isomerase [Halomonas pacifica]
MLQSIRDRSKSWGAKIIIGAIVLTMALFGADALIGLFTGGANDVAKVNGEPITRQEVELQVQRALRSGQVPPEQERALRGQVLDELITLRLLDQYAGDGGLHLSEEQLDRILLTLPQFHDQEGRFDREIFRNRLASAGYTPLGFREQLRSDLRREQLQNGLILSDFTLESERERLASLQRQVRSFRYHRLTADDLEAPVTVSEAEIAAYYEANAERYQRPEQVRLAYVLLDRQRLADEREVSEEQLEAAYAERARDAERRVSHIMVTFGDERGRDEAEARLEEVRERLAEGDDFATLAARYSDDTSSAEQGGDLGFISRGFFGEAFEDAAFALAPGQVSEIVETDNGLHLVAVTELDLPPLEALRDELREEVALAAVSDDFNRLNQRLIDESFAADDLVSVADDLGLARQESDWLTREHAQGVLGEPGVMREAFSDEVLTEGFNSEVIELDEDRRLVVRVAEHRPAATPPLEEVRDRVVAELTAERQQEALVALAETRLDALRHGDTPDWAWTRVEQASRTGDEAVPAAVLAEAFRLPRPDEAPRYGIASSEQGVAVVALEAVSEGEADAELEALVGRMAERLRAQSALTGLLEHLRDEAEVERL